MDPVKLKDIAKFLGGTVVGDPEMTVTHPAGLSEAGSGAVTFLANPKYAPQLTTTKASAAIVGRDISDAPCALIQVDNPDLAFAKIVAHLAGETPKPETGIHRTAIVSPYAKLGKNVAVGAGAVVEAGVVVGDGCIIYPRVVVGAGAVLGEKCILYPGVVLYHNVKLGKRVSVHANSVIGSDGFGYAWDGEKHAKIPQVGTVEICDDVEIGACTAVDRARFGKTVIGPGTKVDNLVQIAHNVKIGAHGLIVAQVGIAGSTELGNGVVAGGQVGFAGHLKIGDRAMFTAQTGVNKNVPAGEHYSGTPAGPHEQWLDKERHLKALGRLRKTVKSLEERLAQLESKQEKAGS